MKFDDFVSILMKFDDLGSKFHEIHQIITVNSKVRLEKIAPIKVSSAHQSDNATEIREVSSAL